MDPPPDVVQELAASLALIVRNAAGCVGRARIAGSIDGRRGHRVAAAVAIAKALGSKTDNERAAIRRNLNVRRRRIGARAGHVRVTSRYARPTARKCSIFISSYSRETTMP